MITDVAPWGESDHLVREAVRSLLRRYGRSYFLDCYRKGREPEALWHDLCKAGYVGAGVPEHLGGAGSSLETVIAVGEELALAGMPLLSFIMTELCLPVLARNALPETAARLLPPIITGDRRLAFAITEPDAGTNSFAMRTTAIRSGPEYIVSGRKRWISSAGDADDLFLVCTDGEPSRREGRRPITILMVDMRSPGISTEVLSADAGTPERQYDVIFDNVRVPTENLVGAEADGAAALFASLNTERVLIAAFAYGVGVHCISRAVDYARERAPFGAPIGGYQAVQHPLAACWAELTAARALNRDAISAVERSDPRGAGLANAAKWLASEAANRAADHAIQVHGGNGITDEYDLIPLWRTTRLMRFAPINNEMVLNQIGQHVLGLPKSY
ncbi:MAG TPA: acyl-CoA dehydrogenase [Actinobacteria bacterium]|nr:acyl-CoA dehydrogenase [Actinomycetota bacterium]